jgi:predicted amidophosphoribosyltransferase
LALKECSQKAAPMASPFFGLALNATRSPSAVLYFKRINFSLDQCEEQTMVDTSRFTIICPCCEANLTVDAQTGAIISHQEKTKPLASFDEMVTGLDKQKQMREQIFAQELSSMKDRDRILEEKFQEAMKRAEKDKDKPYVNPLDLD